MGVEVTHDDQDAWSFSMRGYSARVAPSGAVWKWSATGVHSGQSRSREEAIAVATAVVEALARVNTQEEGQGE